MTTTPVALITGANKGIGFETARRLGALGHTVLVGARDEERGLKAAARLATDGVDACFVHLDVTDGELIARAAAWVGDTYGRLDVLVNNAAVLIDMDIPVLDVTAEHLRQTYEANVFGPVDLIHAFVPLLRRSPRPRVVNLSSGLGSITTNAREYERLAAYQQLAYGSSKAALNAVTVLYANALRADGVKVNAADPGFCSTDINRHRGYRTVEQGAEIVVRLATLDDDGPTGVFVADDGPVPW